MIFSELFLLLKYGSELSGILERGDMIDQRTLTDILSGFSDLCVFLFMYFSLQQLSAAIFNETLKLEFQLWNKRFISCFLVKSSFFVALDLLLFNSFNPNNRNCNSSAATVNSIANFLFSAIVCDKMQSFKRLVLPRLGSQLSNLKLSSLSAEDISSKIMSDSFNKNFFTRSFFFIDVTVYVLTFNFFIQAFEKVLMMYFASYTLNSSCQLVFAMVSSSDG